MPLHVLLVDDSAVMRTMIARTLRLSGVPLGDVVQCGDGRQALEALAARTVDLALVDINMPVMDGEQLLDRIRTGQRTAGLPVIVVSTESSAVRVERLRSKGAHFIHKPFTPEQLRDLIHTVTGHAHDAIVCQPAPAGGDLDF
jgi:two-component system, chemotaxis family, chemotaxis protein CheY